MIPPTKSAAFVWRMEEVLDLYEEPYDPKRPMICFDEQPYQMLSDVRDPLPMKPGRPEHVDFEYQREGNAYVHMTFEPLGGFREVEITERRRGVEFARLMEHLVDDLYPEAEKIRVVLDNLSTHTGAAFYEAFPAQRARSLATTKIEFIYTHRGARLMAEHGGDRAFGFGAAVLKAAYTGHEDVAAGGKSLAKGAQPACYERRLALHHRRRPH